MVAQPKANGQEVIWFEAEAISNAKNALQHLQKRVEIYGFAREGKTYLPEGNKSAKWVE